MFIYDSLFQEISVNVPMRFLVFRMEKSKVNIYNLLIFI